MFVALPRGAKHLCALLVFVVLCVTFWTQLSFVLSRSSWPPADFEAVPPAAGRRNEKDRADVSQSPAAPGSDQQRPPDEIRARLFATTETNRTITVIAPVATAKALRPESGPEAPFELTETARRPPSPPLLSQQSPQGSPLAAVVGVPAGQKEQRVRIAKYAEEKPARSGGGVGNGHGGHGLLVKEHNVLSDRPARTSGLTKSGVAKEGEEVLIEDAFNDMDLQPLPSDVDVHSNQSTIDVIFFAKYAYWNMKVPRGLSSTITSILRHTQTHLKVHILADAASFTRIRRALRQLQQVSRTPISYELYDVSVVEINQRLQIELLRRNFFSKHLKRYRDNIFFMTPMFHSVFEGKLARAIFLDTDLQFRADIADLWAKFADFSKDNIIGIAHDLQPHYRTEFRIYRRSHPHTDVGEARPGKQGFNTGVMLMDFGRMRNSKLYNGYLTKRQLRALLKKYRLNGYLGHQDFFTLLGVEHPEMFYILHCSWNRQLDTSWKAHYGQELFEQYHRCDGPIRVLHGNGETRIPPEP